MLTVKGLVISRHNASENDCFVNILTAEYGVMKMYARGVRKNTAKNHATTQPFSYATFCLEERNERYYLNSSESIHSFYKISMDMKKYALACYFIEIAQYCVTGGQTAKDIMRLLLNSMYLLDEGKRSCEFLKCVFELRFTSEIGMMPQLIGCKDCYKYTADEMYIMIDRACLLCGDDFEYRGFEEDYYHIRINDTVLHTIRYICLIDHDKLFNFKLSDEVQAQVSEIAEKYITKRIAIKFKTLEFYKEMADDMLYDETDEDSSDDL